MNVIDVEYSNLNNISLKIQFYYYWIGYSAICTLLHFFYKTFGLAKDDLINIRTVYTYCTGKKIMTYTFLSLII